MTNQTKATLAGIGLAVLVFGAITGLVLTEIHREKTICAETARGLGLKHEHRRPVGCRVEINGRLVPIKMLRVNDTGEIVVAPET